MSSQDEFFSTESAIGINVRKSPNLGQDILRQTTLKQQIASLKKNKIFFFMGARRGVDLKANHGEQIQILLQLSL